MNPAHAHLVLTHLPVLGSVFGLLVLLVGLIQPSRDVQRCGLLLLVIAGLGAVPAYLTGEPASAILMKMMGSMSDAGDQHAEIAMIALTVSLLLGATGLFGLFFLSRTHPLPKWFTALTLVLGILAASALGWTAHLGGRIRHPEIQQPAPDRASLD